MVPLLHVVTVTGQDWYLLLSWGIGKGKVSLYFTAGKPPRRTLQLQIMFTELIWLAQAHWADTEMAYKLSHFQMYGGWATKFSSFILFPKYIHLIQIRNFGVLGQQMHCSWHNFSRLDQTFPSSNTRSKHSRFKLPLVVFFVSFVFFLMVCLSFSCPSIPLTKWNPLWYNKFPSSSALTVTNIFQLSLWWSEIWEWFGWVSWVRGCYEAVRYWLRLQESEGTVVSRGPTPKMTHGYLSSSSSRPISKGILMLCCFLS